MVRTHSMGWEMRHFPLKISADTVFVLVFNAKAETVLPLVIVDEENVSVGWK